MKLEIMDTAVALLTGTTRGVGDWLVELGKQKAGLVLIAILVIGSFSGGAASVVWWSDFSTWGNRIEDLEDRMDTHVEEVSEPGIARIERLERRQENFREQWDLEWDLEAGGRLAVQAEMVRQLYCGQWPDRCERIPREEEDNP